MLGRPFPANSLVGIGDDTTRKGVAPSCGRAGKGSFIVAFDVCEILADIVLVLLRAMLFTFPV